MKNKIFFQSLAAIFLLSFFTSCERDADVELPKTEPKLVLVSFITPQDTALKVTVTRSQPIFEPYSVNTNSAVADATVIMASTTASVQLTFDAALQYYTAPSTAFPINAGSSYTLTVTTPAGESAEATTTVPLNNPVSGFSISMTDSLYADPNFIQLTADFTYGMNDFAGEENRYRFFSAVIIRDTVTNDTTSLRFVNQLFTDNNKDGQTIQATLRGEWSGYDPFGNQKVIGYDCWMFNVNHDYYKYHTSLYNYSGDDPFSEPTIIYTNVKDGLGVFAAANGVKYRFYR